MPAWPESLSSPNQPGATVGLDSPSGKGDGSGGLPAQGSMVQGVLCNPGLTDTESSASRSQEDPWAAHGEEHMALYAPVYMTAAMCRACGSEPARRMSPNGRAALSHFHKAPAIQHTAQVYPTRGKTWLPGKRASRPPLDSLGPWDT